MSIKASVSLIMDGIKSVKQNVQIRNELRHQAIGLVALDVVGLGLIEKTSGRQACTQILTTLKKLITQLDAEIRVRIIAVKNVGDDFSIFVKLPTLTGGLSRERFLHEEARKLKDILEKRLAAAIRLDMHVELYAGSSLIQNASDTGFQAALYKAMKQANYEAKHIDLEEQLLIQEYNDIVANERFESHFQPILSLASGDAFGMESLLRGPADSHFRSPDRLFNFAQQRKQLTFVDKLAIERSIVSFGSLAAGCKLFLNVDSRTLADPAFTVDNLLKKLQSTTLIPHDVVLEITERNLIGNYEEFNERLDSYRKVGFSIAVDDAGMGYSSLQAITELRPDYIKVDKSLVQHVDREMVKSAMLETLVDFARKVNSSVIAEGIETEEELSKVIQLGIDYGQGYLLGKPAPSAASTANHELVKEIIRVHTAVDTMGYDESVAVGKLTRDIQTFDEKTTVSEVAQYFHNNEQNHSVVVQSGTRPVGLVMRDKLMRYLATQFGVPLYWHRPIGKLMDAAPLMVESTTALNIVSRLSMERGHDKVYDSIIVTHTGELAGIITIQDLLSAMNTIQLERARGSNPLTGLPGNRSIKRELREWIHSGNRFSIIYADIDYFKWFNDCFGFQRGDKVIQFLSEVLIDVCTAALGRGCFVGHIGGDDFIVITDNPAAKEWCTEVIRQFDTQIVRFYTDNASRTEVVGRYGNRVHADGLTLSLSLLQCPSNVTALTLEDVVEEVARLKKAAKEQTGSTCIESELDSRQIN